MTKTNVVVHDVPAGVTSPVFDETAERARMHRLIERAKQLPDIRIDKVRRMRRLIALGRLETPERIDATARRVLEELGLKR